MNVIGIIAEYNPFHNGHAYQLRELKKQTGADYVIVAMSGDFLQRGTPALIDKHTRAKMALSCGADLVLELPCIWASASAEYFGKGGVSLLGMTGVVDTIGYGVETNDTSLQKAIQNVLLDTPESYDKELAFFQKNGLSYPLARTAVICNLLPDIDAQIVENYLSKPNNILSLEYEKAIALWNHETSHKLSGFPLVRIGDDYHAKEAKSKFTSATAIRNLLEERKDVSTYIPRLVQEILQNQSNRFVFPNEISDLLYYKLLLYKEEGYEAFADCSFSLSQKIQKHLYEYQSFDQFCNLLKSKDITYARISRALIHILLHITKEDYEAYVNFPVPYLRVLGFRKAASDLLSQIKKEASAPLITKLADASLQLSKKEFECLQKDIFAADIYRSLFMNQATGALKNEYTQEIIML